MSGGFGEDPFGEGPFGEDDYAFRAFEDALPTVFLAPEQDPDGLLRRYVRAVGAVVQDERDRVVGMETLRDVWRARTSSTGAFALLLGRSVRAVGALEQQGSDGVTLTGGVFSAASARFGPEDLHKVLTADAEGVVSAVVSPTSVLVEPPFSAGSTGLHWTLRTVEGLASGELTFEAAGDVRQLRPGWSLDDGVSVFEVARVELFFAGDGRHVTVREGRGTASGGNLLATGWSVADVMAPVLVRYDDESFVRVLLVNRIISSGEVELCDSVTFEVVALPDTTSLFWSRRYVPRVTVRASAPPRGAVLASGTWATLAGGASSAAKMPGAALTAADVGRYVTFCASGGGAPSHGVISAVTDSVSATVDALAGAPALPAIAGARWELRLPPSLGRADPMILCRPPSELALLAADFGLDVDPTESDARQRGWVAGLSLWRDRKGTAEAYRTVAALSGLSTAVARLWRVGADRTAQIPSDSRFELALAGAGVSGTDGTLVFSGTTMIFTAPSAVFRGKHRSMLLRLSTLATATSDPADADGLYQIRRVLSSTVVEVERAVRPALLPAAASWALTQVYTDLPPTRPLLDEVAPDVAYAHGILPLDRFSWESGYASSLTVTVLFVTQLTTRLAEVRLRGDAHVVGLPGRWRLTDTAGISAWLETTPVQVAAGPPPEFTMRVLSATPITVGAGSLTYDCGPVPTPDYAPVARVLLTLTVSGADAAAKVQRFLRRVREVTPRHVRLLVRLSTDLGTVYEEGVGLALTL